MYKDPRRTWSLRRTGPGKMPTNVLLAHDFLVRFREQPQFCPFQQQQADPLVGKGGQSGKLQQLPVETGWCEATDVGTSWSKIKIIADH